MESLTRPGQQPPGVSYVFTLGDGRQFKTYGLPLILSAQGGVFHRHPVNTLLAAHYIAFNNYQIPRFSPKIFGLVWHQLNGILSNFAEKLAALPFHEFISIYYYLRAFALPGTSETEDVATSIVEKYWYALLRRKDFPTYTDPRAREYANIIKGMNDLMYDSITLQHIGGTLNTAYRQLYPPGERKDLRFLGDGGMIMTGTGSGEFRYEDPGSIAPSKGGIVFMATEDGQVFGGELERSSRMVGRTREQWRIGYTGDTFMNLDDIPRNYAVRVPDGAAPAAPFALPPPAVGYGPGMYVPPAAPFALLPPAVGYGPGMYVPPADPFALPPPAVGYGPGMYVPPADPFALRPLAVGHGPGMYIPPAAAPSLIFTLTHNGKDYKIEYMAQYLDGLETIKKRQREGKIYPNFSPPLNQWRCYLMMPKSFSIRSRTSIVYVDLPAMMLKSGYFATLIEHYGAGFTTELRMNVDHEPLSYALWCLHGFIDDKSEAWTALIANDPSNSFSYAFQAFDAFRYASPPQDSEILYNYFNDVTMILHRAIINQQPWTDVERKAIFDNFTTILKNLNYLDLRSDLADQILYMLSGVRPDLKQIDEKGASSALIWGLENAPPTIIYPLRVPFSYSSTSNKELSRNAMGGWTYRQDQAKSYKVVGEPTFVSDM